MRDELTTRLEAALETERSYRSPDLAWVVARGRRLRVLKFASAALSVAAAVGVITTAVVALSTSGDSPNPGTGDNAPAPQESSFPQTARRGEVVEDMTDREQAEVFAFRALAATGLMDPFGERSYLFTSRDDTTTTAEGWRIGFAASDCEPRGGTFTCRGLSGEDTRENALTDTYVTVALDDGEWRVVEVEGNILDDERERVVGYSLPQREEPSHWEFPAVGVWHGDEGISIHMMPVWVGPYPTSAPGSVCEATALNAAGEPVGDLTRFFVEAPNREFERAGWVRGTEMDPGRGVARVTVSCRQYTGRGWEVASDPRMVGGRDEVSGVTAELVWRGDEGLTTAAVCRAALVDEAGEVVWEGTSKVEPLWRPSEVKEYPYRTDVFISTRGESVDAQEIGEFNCKSL